MAPSSTIQPLMVPTLTTVNVGTIIFVIGLQQCLHVVRVFFKLQTMFNSVLQIVRSLLVLLGFIYFQ